MRSPIGRLCLFVLFAAAIYCGAIMALSRKEQTHFPPLRPEPRPAPIDEGQPSPDRQTYEVEIKEYTSPPRQADEFTDDQLDEQRVPAFDPERVHSEPYDGWELNLSSAVIRLDTPKLRPDIPAEVEWMKLHPSYHAALEAVRTPVLPSVNLLDGKAKQFDDGLYAALDLAYYSGLEGALRSHVDFIRKLATELGPDSPATPFLAAGLELADVPCEVTDVAARDQFLRDFQANPHFSKPVGFYNWRPELQRCFRFLRFFQQEFANDLDRDPAGKSAKTLQPIAALLKQNDELQGAYRSIVEFYSKLTNPPISQTLLDLVGQPNASSRVSRDTIAVIPSSTSRETVLFERMFPNGLPPNVDLMQTLVREIRSGKVDLKPDEQSGWYEYQVYALETLILPDRSEESAKLLLTANYKRRMVEAFAAMITTRARNTRPATRGSRHADG
jgi:hypothetical protein